MLGIKKILNSILVEKRGADRALEVAFGANKQWGGRDRRFVAEAVYEIVRWRRRLQACANQLSSQESEREAASQNEPQNEIEDLVRCFGALKGWDGFKAAAAASSWEATGQLSTAIRESIPDWLDAWGRGQLNAQWDAEIAALNEQAPVDLRVNTLRTTAQALQKNLKSEGINAESLGEEVLTLSERKNVFATKAFQRGEFEVQDRSSQLIAPFLKVELGHRVIDACAGAGGKTLHLATLLKGTGQVLALDISDRKLDELRRRAKRHGLYNIEARLIVSSETIKRLEESADRLLLDVPCSGLGVLRRNPDQKWRLSVSEIEKLRALQREILGNYSGMVKRGGLLVYATCSFMPDENERQVEWFCEKSGYELEEQFTVLPSQRAGDGFYAARLRRC